MKGIIPTEQFNAREELPTCGETIRSPSKRLIKNPARQSRLATFYAWLDLSGDDTMDWILDQIYQNYPGHLIDFNGNEIDRSKWFVEELFTDEPSSWIEDFMLQATKPMKQRLQERCVNRVMAMYFARDIYLLRYA